MQSDIIAYHHTSYENGKSILRNGFNSNRFVKIHLGYGVQCVLNKMNEPLFGGNLEGQVVVEFKNCRYLDIDNISDRRIIIGSIDKIIEAEPYEKQLKVAKLESQRLRKLGYDAYTHNYNTKKIIIFLNFPTPTEWVIY